MSKKTLFIDNSEESQTAISLLKEAGLKFDTVVAPPKNEDDPRDFGTPTLLVRGSIFEGLERIRAYAKYIAHNGGRDILDK